MARKRTNKPFESSVPTTLLLKGTVSAPVLNGHTQRQSDVVGTLSVLDFQERVILVTCNHVIRKWADKGPLVSPILEIELTEGEGRRKWVSANLKRYRWAGVNIGVTEDDPDGYYDLRVAVVPKDETDQINKDLLLPVHYVSDINAPYFAVLTGYPEKKNTRDEMRKRKPHPWAKPWWFEQFTKDQPTGDERLVFDWTHKNRNFIYEQQASRDSAIFVSTGVSDPSTAWLTDVNHSIRNRARR